MNIGILIDVVVICLVDWLFYWLISLISGVRGPVVMLR